MSEWIDWNGGVECPTAKGSDVSVKFRDGSVHRDDAPQEWDWAHWSGRSTGEIVAYQVHEKIDPRSAAAHYGQDLKVGDSHEALTFHPLQVVDVMGSTVRADIPGAVRRNWDRPGYDTEQSRGREGDGPPVGRSTEPGLAINPKDAIGATKIPVHLFPAEAVAMGSLGMLEGREKYGENNFVAADGVVASIYIDAAMRHLQAWFAGEDNAHDSGIPHLGHALATIAIVVKCQAHGKLIDDRSYSPQPGGVLYRAFIEKLTPHVKRIQKMYEGKKPRHFTIADVVANDSSGKAAA